VTPRIGLIGIGEAGAAIGAGLRDENDLAVVGYDARGDDAVVRDRAAAAGIRLVGSLAELAASAEILLCLTSAKVALSVAAAAAPHLGPDHVYADWNSAGPRLKRDIAQVVEATGASFVDGAVMAAVPPHRHRVPVLLSGGGAERLCAAVEGLGLDLEVLGPEPGAASAVKMFRSLLVKGLEALLLECAVGAHEYGATDRVLSSMNGTLPTDDWRELASYLLGRTVLHGARRAEELRQVARTLDDIGVEPLLADAGARRLQWFADLGLDAAELDYDAVLAAARKVRDQ
jgi:3-hydroxyisobutyrate dehydrogenase-like beta-hydroxyacid dehydrogenase